MTTTTAVPPYAGFVFGAVLKTGSSQAVATLKHAVFHAGHGARLSWWCDPVFHTCQWREESAAPNSFELLTSELLARDGDSANPAQLFEERSIDEGDEQDPRSQIEAHGVSIANESLFVPRSGGRRLFRIVQVREPCDYAASVWSFSGRSHEHAHLAGWCHELVGGSSNPESGLESFRSFVTRTSSPRLHWLGHRIAMHLLGLPYERLVALASAPLCPSQADAAWTERLTSTLEQAATSSLVDCWVHTERLYSDLEGCLDLYRRFQRGHSRFPFAVVQNVIAHAKGHANGTGLRANANEGRSSCEALYNEVTARHVWSRDGEFAKSVGYTGCCRGIKGS